MKANTLARSFITVMVLASSLLWWGTTSTFAQRAFTVSPVVLDKGTVQPGEVFTEVIRLRNAAPEARDVSVLYMDIEPYGDDGQFHPIEDEELTGDSRVSMRDWVIFDNESIVVPPEAEQRWTEFLITIRVPEDATPGVHYGSLYFLPDTADPEELESSGMILQARHGYAMIMNVAGDILEDAEVTEFSATPSFAEHGPINLSTKTKNNGTGYLKPVGTITISNMLGMTVAEIPFNNSDKPGAEKRVLPDLERKFETEWDDMFITQKENGDINVDWSKVSKFRIGSYTATLDATYGEAASPLTAKTSFIIFPWKIFTIALIVLILLFLGIWQYMRWNEQRIVEKYKAKEQEAASGKKK